MLANQTRRSASVVLAVALLVGILGWAAPAHASTVPAPGYDLWLRADVGVTVNIDKVSAWANQSGYGKHATMSTPSRQPALVLNALNGLPVIRFGGAQSLNLTIAANPTYFTVFVVGKNSKPTESFSMILGPSGNNPNNQMRWENGTKALFVGTGNGMPASTSTIGNTRVYHALSARYNGSQMTVYRDGSATSTHTFTTTGPWILSSIGSYYSYYSSYFMMGDLAEIIIYPFALSETDRATTNAYLRNKYALP